MGTLIKTFIKTSVRKTSFSETLFSLLLQCGVIALFSYLYYGLVTGFSRLGMTSQLWGIALIAAFVFSFITQIPEAASLLFENDRILLPLPLGKAQIYTAKLLVFYGKTFIKNMILLLPLAICYVMATDVGAAFVPSAVLSMIFLPLWSAALSAAVCPLWTLIKRFMSRYRVISLICCLVILIALFWVYGKILGVFNSLLENGRLASLFNIKNVKTVNGMVKYFVPVNFIVFLLRKKYLAGIFGIIGGTAVLCAIAFVVLKFVRIAPERQHNYGGKGKINKPEIALLKKEFLLLVRSDALYGFVLLTVGMPVLASLACFSIEHVIRNSLGLNFIFPFSFMLLLLFVAVIDTSSGKAVCKGEQPTITRSIPINPVKQSLIKAVLPLAAGIISYAVSVLVLRVASVWETIDMLIALAVGLPFVISAVLGSVSSSVRYKKDSGTSVWQFILALVLPLLYIVFEVAMSHSIALIVIVSVELLSAALSVYRFAQTVRGVKK